MEGWIKLHRELLESEIFASEKGLKIWVWLLIKARINDGFVSILIGQGQHIIELKRGQLLFGRFSAEEQLSMSGSTIYKWLKKLEQLGMINLQSNSHSTTITIVKYNEYQGKSNSQVPTNELPIDSQVPTNELPIDSQVPTEYLPSNTNKKDNKGNNDNKKKERKEENPLAKILFADMKSFFLDEYSKKINSDYYWGVKDSANLNQLITKIKFKIKEKEKRLGGKEKENYNEDILTGFKHLLLSSKDKWINSQFTIPIFNSKFNEIFTQILTNNGKPIINASTMADAMEKEFAPKHGTKTL